MATVASAPVLEDEIDLRRYLDGFLRRWKFIAAITCLTVILTALVSFFVLPTTYTATAGVLVSSTRDELNFDPKFKTEYQANADSTPRRTALTHLATSSTLAAQVIAKLGDTLPPSERRASQLLDNISVSTQGDLIEITATGRTPEQAAAIANAWADVFTSQVSQVYSLAGTAPSEIKAQADSGWTTYEQAQRQFEQFLTENKLATLEQQVKLKQAQLTDNYATVSRLDRLIGDARSLQAQLNQSAGGSSANPAPLLLLKLNAFSASSRTGDSDPLPLQLTLDGAANGAQPAATQAQEVQTILTVLEARRRELQAQIDSTGLQEELARLQQAQEQENARYRTLVQARDLAWDTYNTLARKQAEVGVASQLSDAEVRLAVTAVPPETPTGPRHARNLALAGLMGLLFGIVGAGALELVNSRNRPSAL